MLVIDLREDIPARTLLAVGQRVRLDCTDQGAGIVSGIITEVTESEEVKLSGRDLPSRWFDRIEVIGQVDSDLMLQSSEH